MLDSESQAEQKPIPTPEKYTELTSKLKETKENLQAYSRGIVERQEKGILSEETKLEHEKLVRQARLLQQRHNKMRQEILDNTDAVPYKDGFVVLKEDTNKEGKPIIRVTNVWDDLGINVGLVTDTRLGQAPREFREAMYGGPYLLKNDEGELDVTIPYRKIPETYEPETREQEQKPEDQALEPAA